MALPKSERGAMPTRLNIVRLARVFNMFNRVGIAPRVLHGNSSIGLTMLVWLAVKLGQISPWCKRTLWRRWYQYLAGQKLTDWRFMNYGFTPLNESELRELEKEDEADRYAIQLYDHVAGAVPLEGRDVLEVGSGRGGGSSFISRYHKPKHMTGVDYSAKVVSFCKENHSVDGLSFEHGDAERLPFDDESFDVVVNVESSHCYGSVPNFLKEVRRVLRSNGHFVFADLRGQNETEGLHKQLVDSQMEVLEQEDITANVLEALRLDSERKTAMIERLVSKRLIGTFRRFAAVEGSDVYNAFRDGAMVYLRYVLQKNGCHQQR